MAMLLAAGITVLMLSNALHTHLSHLHSQKCSRNTQVKSGENHQGD